MRPNELFVHRKSSVKALIISVVGDTVTVVENGDYFNYSIEEFESMFLPVHETQTNIAKPMCAQEELAQVAHKLLALIDPNHGREETKETPLRFAKACDTWFGGYNVDIDELFKTFKEPTADGVIVIRKGIPIRSHCEHHLAAIKGTCDIAYMPNNHIIGLSKLDRLVDAFARRLQVQERLTRQIGETIFEKLNCACVVVRVRATHDCIETRGVCNENSETETWFSTMGDNGRQELLQEVTRLLL